MPSAIGPRYCEPSEKPPACPRRPPRYRPAVLQSRGSGSTTKAYGASRPNRPLNCPNRKAIWERDPSSFECSSTPGGQKSCANRIPLVPDKWVQSYVEKGRHMNQTQKRTLITVAALTLLSAGCTKKPVAVAPPPPAAAPSATSKPAPPPARTATTQRPASTTPAPRYPSAATRARI